MKFGKNSVLGIALDGQRVEAALVHAWGGSPRTVQQVSGQLAWEPATGDGTEAGRLLRAFLDGASLHERHCVVAMPVSWALTAAIQMPEIDSEDQAGYLSLQAEKEFPFAAADLALAMSPPPVLPGTALLCALPAARLRALESLLHEAGLKPLCITLAATVLSDSPSLYLTRSAVELCLRHGEAIQLLRSLPGPTVAGDTLAYDAESLNRELRITLARAGVPEGGIESLQVFGESALAEPFVEAMGGVLGGLRLAVAASGEGCGPAAQAAIRIAAGNAPALNFLPPKIAPFRRWLTRAASGGVRRLVPAGALLLLILCAAFLYQAFRLGRLESRWEDISPTAERLGETQERVRTFRPWFQDGAPTLDLAQALTAAFPEEGTVSARSITVKDAVEVTCAGESRSDAAWLQMMDQLRTTDGVSDLKVRQISGDSPMQFSISYRWEAE